MSRSGALQFGSVRMGLDLEKTLMALPYAIRYGSDSSGYLSKEAIYRKRAESCSADGNGRGAASAGVGSGPSFSSARPNAKANCDDASTCPCTIRTT